MKKLIILMVTIFLSSCAAERTWKETIIPDICLGNVIWTGSQFAIIGEGVNGLAYMISSNDGLNWSTTLVNLDIKINYPPYYDGTIELHNLQLKWLNNQFVVIIPTKNDSDTLKYIAFSGDGVNWTHNLGTSLTLNSVDIIWDGQHYILVGNVGYFLTSLDLINWTQLMLPDPNWWFLRIQYVNSHYFANGNGMFMSTDGITWEKFDFLKNGGHYNLYFEENKYIAIGALGEIYTSQDLNSWENHSIILGPTLSHLTHGIDDYVAVVNGPDQSMEIWSSKNLSWWRQYVYIPPINIIAQFVASPDNSFTGVAHDGKQYVVSGYEAEGNGNCTGVILTSP